MPQNNPTGGGGARALLTMVHREAAGGKRELRMVHREVAGGKRVLRIFFSEHFLEKCYNTIMSKQRFSRTYIYCRAVDIFVGRV